MRFLEFVSYCGLPMRRADDERSLMPMAALASAPARAPALAGGSCTFRHVRRGKMVGPDWRPSLGSISEDNAAMPLMARGGHRNGAATISGKRKSSGSVVIASSAKVRHRSKSDGYHRSATIPTILPPFSATPFMF